MIPLREIPFTPFHQHKQDKNTVLLKHSQHRPFFVGFIPETLLKLILLSDDDTKHLEVWFEMHEFGIYQIPELVIKDGELPEKHGCR